MGIKSALSLGLQFDHDCPLYLIVFSSILSACGRARPPKDQRHVPVLRGWQQDPLLPPLGPFYEIL